MAWGLLLENEMEKIIVGFVALWMAAACMLSIIYSVVSLYSFLWVPAPMIISAIKMGALLLLMIGPFAVLGYIYIIRTLTR